MADDTETQSWISRKCQNLEPCRSWLGLAAAIFSFLMVALGESFGVYYEALIEKYDSTRQAVGWIYSFRWIFVFISGVYITPLIELFGCRTVVMVFGFLYAAATSLSAIAPTVGSLYFIYGVLTGAAASGIYMGTMTAIQKLFTTNRGLATGFATIGFPLGVLIHPLHTKYFLDLFGVSGVYMMQGAIILHIMIAAFAFKTPKLAATKKTNNKHHNELPEESQSDVKRAGNPDKSSSPVDKRVFIKTYLKGLADFSLLKNVCFVLCIFQYMLLWSIRLGISSQIVNCAMYRGIPHQQATYLLSMVGFFGLCMAALSGVILNMSWINSALYSGFAALCLSVSAFLCAFGKTYEVFAVSAMFMGVSDGVAIGNLPLMVLYVVGLERFPRGMALLWSALIPSAGSSAFVGWMVDKYDNFFMPFIILAVGGITSAILSILVAGIRTRKKRKLAPESQVTVTTKL